MLAHNDYNKVPQPEDFDLQLFEHQLVSIYNMEMREKVLKISIGNNTYAKSRLGILGDCPGYGKTASIVGLLVRDKMKWSMDEQFKKIIPTHIGHDGIFTIHSEVFSHKLPTNLIICSTSIIEQWEEMLAKTTLNYQTIITRSDVEEVEPINHDVLLCSLNRYNELAEKWKGFVWKRFIYDEPTSTHIPKMREVQAGFYWMVTATYTELCNFATNRQHFIRSLFKHMQFSILEKLVVKNPDAFVKASYNLPPVKYITHECLNPKILGVVNLFIPPEVKEMIQAGNIAGAIKHLGGEKSGNIIEIVTNKKREELKEAEYKVDKYTNKEKNKKELEIWTKRVKELKKNIEDIEKKYKEMISGDCPICYVGMESPVMSPCCQHVFCGSCVIDWLEKNHTCPMCRTNLPIAKLISVNVNGKGEGKEEKVEIRGKILKTKPDTICDIILECMKKNKNSRIIIFSAHDESFGLIRTSIPNEQKLAELKGTKESRMNRLKEFKNGECKILFLNSKFNGAGINLPMGTDIILYHEMADHLKKQIVGRCNRIGQSHELVVHTLV